MTILTLAEKEFLDVFLCEATNSPFTGPATQALHAIGVEYHDLSYLSWAYHHEVRRDSFGWGHPADAAPPLPWPNREAALRRNREVERMWQERQEPARAGNRL